MPKESPKIFGPIILPSICWITMIIIINNIAFCGDINKIIKNDGTAPINGPKNGIIFVSPIIKETNIAYGILTNIKTTKVKTATIIESKIFPLKKFPKISLALLV